MVVSCRSVSSYNCIASPDGCSYLPEGSCSLISSQHLAFPWWLIDDGQRDNIRSSFSIIWEEVAGFKFTGYWYSINWKGQCWRRSLVVPLTGSSGVLLFVDLNRTMGFCFKQVDLVVCWEKTWFHAWEILPRYQFPRGCHNLLLVPSVKASWRSLTKSFHTVEFGLAWLG
jgi:hypothetical protein